MRKSLVNGMLILALAIPTQSVLAKSRILATGGASPIEGGGGGGISPWAVIAGYASTSEWGSSVFATKVATDDLQLDVAGVALGFNNRFELSYAEQSLDVDPLGLILRQKVYGAKVKLFGELLYTKMPQFSLGLAYKKHRDPAVPELLGATDDSGTDVYLSASKLFFAAVADRNLFLNATIRSTAANETGLLGFGGPEDSRSIVFEGSVVGFLNDQWVVGYEYRQKPEHLSAVAENAWQDVFVGYFHNKHLAVVAAYADLDEVAGLPDQTGSYLSLQITF